MNSVFKKILPITLLLLSGCAPHHGLLFGGPYYHGSYDISVGSYFYKDHHHRYKPRGYIRKWRNFYPRHYDRHYQSDHRYRGEKHHKRPYWKEHKYYDHKRVGPKYYDYEDSRC